MPVTIRDVARLAGVSPSTVSRTVRDNPAISAATKARVRQAMEELGYIPPNPVETESSGPSLPQQVGIILPPSTGELSTNPFFLEVMRGICEYCNRCSVETLLFAGQNEPEILSALRSARLHDPTLAFILLFSRKDDPIENELYESGCDYVLIGTPADHANDTVCVDNDNIAAGTSAAQYLYDLGHRRFCFVGSSFDNVFSASRRNGLRLFLSEKGVDSHDIDFVELEHGSDEGHPLLREILSRPADQRPTAFVTSDDLHALALRQLVLEAGLSIPDDLSIVSFNNSVFATLVSPKLTSIDVHPLQLGREAARQAIARLNEPVPASKTLIPFTLVERESCAAKES